MTPTILSQYDQTITAIQTRIENLKAHRYKIRPGDIGYAKMSKRIYSLEISVCDVMYQASMAREYEGGRQ